MLNCKAVIKIGTKWFSCDIVNNKIKNKKSIKSFTEYKNKISEKLITFKKYIKDNKIVEVESFLEENDIKSMYVKAEEKIKPKTTKVKTENKTKSKPKEYIADPNFKESEYEKSFYSKLNNFCMKCKNDCKQSFNVKIEKCLKYTV